MGKKKGTGKGAAGKPNKPAKSPFAVSSAKNKKKPKEVKSNLKKIKANVKAQQEKSDEKLKTLHKDMVVKKPAPTKKKPEKKAKKAPAASTKSTRQSLGKLQV